MPPTVEEHSLNHWTTREFLVVFLLLLLSQINPTVKDLLEN